MKTRSILIGRVLVLTFTGCFPGLARTVFMARPRTSPLRKVGPSGGGGGGEGHRRLWLLVRETGA
ncbi:MAG: hypothetical protein K2Q10_01850, partial [Rhodospirillales bacterium]|nr:hypothetical protein [Rhodospirillales bacterium]